MAATSQTPKNVRILEWNTEERVCSLSFYTRDDGEVEELQVFQDLETGETRITMPDDVSLKPDQLIEASAAILASSILVTALDFARDRPGGADMVRDLIRSWDHSGN